MQSGQLFKRNGAWHLRFYSEEFVNGKPVRKRISKRLAPINDTFRSQKDVWPLAEEILAPLNRGALPASAMSFGEFFDTVFLPHIKSKRKPSTAKFYNDAYRFHLKTKVGSISLRDFNTAHAQRVLDEIPLSHQSLLRIKTAMSAVFTVARQKDYIRTANPVVGSKAEGHATGFKPYAYSVDEIIDMLGKLPEPARSAVAVAAFTGLREGEIRGLRWEDFTGDTLNVRRSIWRTHVHEPKTEKSIAPVPVIPFLEKILVAHRQSVAGNGWIFAGEKKRFALNLDNVTARLIRPALGDKWKGWHACRRGISTNLYTLGVKAKVIQAILRHARVETTSQHYIIVEAQKAGGSAMRKLEKAVKRATDGQQKARPKSAEALKTR